MSYTDSQDRQDSNGNRKTHTPREKCSEIVKSVDLQTLF